MAKKSTRVKKTKSSWKKWLLGLLPVLVLGFLILNNTNTSNILGVSDKNLFNIKEKSGSSKNVKPTPIPSCNRIVSFGANSICEFNSKGNNSFSNYSYSCEDGTSGNVTQPSGKCMPIEKAFESARKACNKKCKPTSSPIPTASE